jgi:hypothetical protein
MTIEAYGDLYESNMCEHAPSQPKQSIKEKTKIMLPNDKNNA